jgi:phage terminase small subunit
MAEIKTLTEKEELFCQGYLIDFNGARAAREAGYSADSARQIATENLSKPHIQDRIQELRQGIGKKFNITLDRIAQEYGKMAFGDIRKIFKDDGSLLLPSEWDDDTAAAIAGIDTDELFEGVGRDREQIGVTKKVKLSDKRAALDSLVKLMGYAAPSRTELTGADGKDLNYTVTLDLGNTKNTINTIPGAEAGPTDKPAQ